MKKLSLILFLVVLLVASSFGAVAFGATEELEEYPGTDSKPYEAMPNEYAETEWFFANAGSNAKGTYSVNDGVVNITPEEGKGKMADSEEGFCFYYTKIDATKENFYLRATFTVTKWKNDNQNGFGLICTDTVGTQNTGRYMNYVAAGCYKTSGSNYNIPAARSVWGYISADGTSPSEDVTGTGDSLRQYSASALKTEESHSEVKGVNVSYTFVLRKSNTGYHAILTESPEGKGFAEKVYYDAGKLLAQDGENPDYVYVGFFASRNVGVQVTDAFFVTPESATDERKYDEPPTLVPLQLSVFASSYRSGSDYLYSVRSNADGTLEVVDGSNNVLVDNVHLSADELFTTRFALAETGTVLLKTRFYPDSSRISAGVVQTYVYQHSLPGAGGVIWANPTVKEGNGDGTAENPVNLQYALNYAQPGQIIMLKDGVYKPVNKITIPRGVNGTEEKPIVLRAETAGGVTFDFSEVKNCKNEGIQIAGDYWYIWGINVVNTPASQTDSEGNVSPLSIKGLRISGSHNVLERCTAHHNSNTGIQISGDSKESYACWPAYNLIKNCDSYFNCDPTRQDADGFGVKLTVGDGNVLDGCIAYNNIDDGYDLYAKSVTGSIGAVVIKNCVAYNNGYLSEEDLSDSDLTGEGNGFKLGGESLPGKHQLINSVAFGNGAKGITSNSCPDVIIQNCTVYNNNVYADTQGASNENVSLYAKRSGQTTNFVVSGLISITSGRATKTDKYALVNQSDIKAENNYLWNGSACTNGTKTLEVADLFVSTDIKNVGITRDADGEIDMNGLLVLKDGAVQNAGANIVAAESQATLEVVQTQIVEKQFDSLVEKFESSETLEEKQSVLEHWDVLAATYGNIENYDEQTAAQRKNTVVKNYFEGISEKFREANSSEEKDGLLADWDEASVLLDYMDEVFVKEVSQLRSELNVVEVWLIVVIIVAALALVAVGAVVFRVIKKRKSSNKKQ